MRTLWQKKIIPGQQQVGIFTSKIFVRNTTYCRCVDIIDTIRGR